MAAKLVVDTSSIIRYVRYFYFDKDNGKDIYDKLNGFFISKIKSKEIIIINKVFEELDDPEFESFRKKIKLYVKGDIHLFTTVQSFIKKHYIKSNEKYCNNNPAQINNQLRRYEERYADLYLVAYSKELLTNGHDVTLITEEVFKDKYYTNLIKKIPAICVNEGIKCKNLSYVLFEFYKNNLKFDLEAI